MRTTCTRRLPQITALAVCLSLAMAYAGAQTIIDRANGYTLTGTGAGAGDLQRFTSLAFDAQGRVVAVGSEAQTAAALPGARHVDVQGKTVLPWLPWACGLAFAGALGYGLLAGFEVRFSGPA